MNLICLKEELKKLIVHKKREKKVVLKMIKIQLKKNIKKPHKMNMIFSSIRSCFSQHLKQKNLIYALSRQSNVRVAIGWNII